MTAVGYASTTGDTRKVNRAGDTMTGELTLPDSSPDTALAAAAKGYVDAQILALANQIAAAFAALTGATFTGALNVNGYTTLAGAQTNNDFTVFGAFSAAGDVGFHGATPIAKPTVSGSKGGNAALGNLITALALYGLITDGTS
ncbi:MAG: hypothetical protein HOV82_17060 [Streptomyces sp.]|nr:hypothetical protein [Streptomyces sp.]NUP36199.1 hypothetical protein [Streptomyces sp.]NUS75546.1 hypothetical protein [Streptomyces sp.]